MIPHRNGRDLLLTAIRAVERAVNPSTDNIVVVDNGSTDDSLTALRAAHPQVHIEASAWNLGFGRAVNRGMRCGDHPFILILNNDCVLTREALDGLLAVAEREPKIGLVGPQLRGANAVPQRSFGMHPTVASEMGLGGTKVPREVPRNPAIRDVETLVGACMLASREAVDATGGFNERFFFYFEETEWCLRLHRAGFRIVVVPSVTVVHGRGESTRALRREAQIEMLRSRLLYYRCAFSPAVATWLTLWRILRLIVNALFLSIATLLTLGLAQSMRQRWATYVALLGFLFSGQPRMAGLPGKEPS